MDLAEEKRSGDQVYLIKRLRLTCASGEASQYREGGGGSDNILNNYHVGET